MNITPTLATMRHDLVATPLSRADVPLEVKVRLGRLIWFLGARQRPFVSIVFTCPQCGKLHRHPWRGDWPPSADVVSFQASHCRRDKQPIWITLDDETLPASVAVLEEARAAFSAWKAGGVGGPRCPAVEANAPGTGTVEGADQPGS